jgi:hypothetical protein
MTWSEDKADQLRQLWGEGHSASKVGRTLGMTRNAVIGKVHRLGLPERVSQSRRGPAQRKPQTPGLAGPASKVSARAQAKDAGNHNPLGWNGGKARKAATTEAAPEPVALPEPIAPPSIETAIPFEAATLRVCRWPLWPHAAVYRDIPASERLVCGGGVGYRRDGYGIPVADVYCPAHRQLARPRQMQAG